jgi:50S ribosomal protein L16 3-hydroxylase
LCNDGEREVVHGPFGKRLFRDLPAQNWTLLVQGVNHVLPGARDLLRRFSFLPHARLDDLMVSYAVPGGGVGPHVDSYDVFLLQGSGNRSWQVSKQSDLELVADSPLKILKAFRPAGSCIVGNGDMLYLPPHFAHDGVALDPCFTYSIGFRAPEYQELKSQFLAYLDDHIQIDGRYRDPRLTVPAHPGEISSDMIIDVTNALSRIRWTRSTVVDFVGRYLSEPKRHIVLHPPPDPGFAEFSRRARSDGIELHPALPLLFHGSRCYINGEAFKIRREERASIVALADKRRLTSREVRDAGCAIRTYYDWYVNCFLDVGKWDPS